MARRQLVGATAAAMLPAALSAAVLVSAPFAGTTTSPLADSMSVPVEHAPAGHAPAGHAHTAARPAAKPAAQPAAGAKSSDSGLSFDISPGSVAMLATGEALLLGVGAGVIVWARRRRYAED